MAAQAVWPGEDVEDLIEHFENEEDLWNISRANYSKKECRRRALERISDAMENKYTADAINRKIIQMRSYYTRELSKLRKSQKSGASTDEIYKSKWPYFTFLHQFLHDQITPRGSFTNMNFHCKEEYEDDDNDGDEETNDESANEDLHGLQTQRLPSVTKKRKLSGPNVVVSETLTGLSDFRARPFPVSVSRSIEEDEDIIFARYIASEMKKVQDSSLKTNLKLSIMKQIFEAQKEDKLLRQ